MKDANYLIARQFLKHAFFCFGQNEISVPVLNFSKIRFMLLFKFLHIYSLRF